MTSSLRFLAGQLPVTFRDLLAVLEGSQDPHSIELSSREPSGGCCITVISPDLESVSRGKPEVQPSPEMSPGWSRNSSVLLSK